MKKRDVVISIASVTAGVAAWTELGRGFAAGDKEFGEVGLINTTGRIALKATGAILAYVFTNCCFDWLFNAKDKVVVEYQTKGEGDTEASIEEPCWECEEEADCIDDCESCDKYIEAHKEKVEDE